MCVTWRIHVCDVTHSYVWHDVFICVTWRIHMCDMTHSYVWHDAFLYVTWLIHMYDMIFSWLICMCDMTWRIHMCDMPHSHVTWLIHVWHPGYVTWERMSHMRTHMWHATFTCDMIHSCEHPHLIIQTWHAVFECDIHMCDMTHWYVWHDDIYIFIHTHTHIYIYIYMYVRVNMQHSATHRTTLHQTAPHSNRKGARRIPKGTLQHTATHRNTLRLAATLFITL